MIMNYKWQWTRNYWYTWEAIEPIIYLQFPHRPQQKLAHWFIKLASIRVCIGPYKPYINPASIWRLTIIFKPSPAVSVTFIVCASVLLQLFQIHRGIFFFWVLRLFLYFLFLSISDVFIVSGVIPRLQIWS